MLKLHLSLTILLKNNMFFDFNNRNSIKHYIYLIFHEKWMFVTLKLDPSLYYVIYTIKTFKLCNVFQEICNNVSQKLFCYRLISYIILN